MAHLNKNTVTGAGTTQTLVAANGGGDTFDSGTRSFLTVKNGGGSGITVTVTSPGVCSQGFTHDLVVSVAAGATVQIGPLDPARFGDTAAVSYSGVTTVTVGVFTT